MITENVRPLLNQHTKGLVKDVTMIDHYFIHENMLNCVDFVYYANREGCLDEGQVIKYRKTFPQTQLAYNTHQMDPFILNRFRLFKVMYQSKYG